MDDLKSIIKLLSAQKLKQIEIITEEVQLSEKTRMLYEGIRDGIYNSDEEAASDLYGSDPKDDTYRKLKYRLKERLLNTVFFIDIQNYSKSPYEKALDRTYKTWSLARILFEKGLRSLAVNLIETSLKSTLKFDLTDLTYLIVKELRLHYGLYAYNAYKYNKYSELISEFREKLVNEEQAQGFFTVLGHEVSSSKSYTYSDRIKEIEKELTDFYNHAKDIDAYFLQYYLLNSLYFLNLIKDDNTVLKMICDRAIDYFNKKKGFPPQAVFSFNQKKGISLLTDRKYDEAIKQFNYCLSLNPREGGLSWQYLYNYIFHTQILKKDYIGAYETTSFILNNPKFQQINESFKQPWYLKEAFVHFLIKIGKINPSESNAKPLRAFRITRFLNDIEQFSKDKRGLNITINIIQMLYLIIEEKYDEVLDKLSSLKQYNFRYLKRPEYARSSNFIKMMLKIPEANYERNAIELKAEKYYKNLQNEKSRFSEHDLNIEIIPYEQLWEETLSIFS